MWIFQKDKTMNPNTADETLNLLQRETKRDATIGRSIIQLNHLNEHQIKYRSTLAPLMFKDSLCIKMGQNHMWEVHSPRFSMQEIC